MKRDFLTIFDITEDEIASLLKRAIEMKSGVDANKCPLIGKSIGLFFEKPSTRTRVSFEVGVYQLGAQPICLTPKDIQLGRGETIADTARTLSRYLNGMVMRVFKQSTVEEFARCATVPVINGLSDFHHPCQALADLMTVIERKGHLEGLLSRRLSPVWTLLSHRLKDMGRMQLRSSVPVRKGRAASA
jgi:ornithine carbamoyltransferase